MAQWYCYVAGQQYGPVGDEQLRRWAAEGRVRPGDYVWTAGMADWAPAGSVPGLFAAPAAVAAQTPVAPPGGSGGRMGVGLIISTAWEQMRGRWGLAIGFSVLYLLLQIGIAMVPYVGGLASLLLIGPLTLGAAVFFLTYIRRGQAQIGMLFAGFRNFGNALGAYLLTVLFIVLGMFLAASPGVAAGIIVGVATEPWLGLIVGAVLAGTGLMIVNIVLGLMFSQTFYLMADNPSLGPMQAIRGSMGIMRGNKLRLFLLMLLLGLMHLLCVLVICVGWVFLLVFILPFASVCWAVFHDDLHPPAAQPAPVLPPSQPAGAEPPQPPAPGSQAAAPQQPEN